MPDPDEIAAQSFTKVRKGYEVDEVRAYLVALSSQVREARRIQADDARRLAELERRNADPDALDETKLTQLLGEETARVLETARQAAADIRSRAEQEVSEARAAAEADATAARAEADEYAASTRDAADQYAQGTRSDADAYAEATRASADADAVELRSAASEEAARMRGAAETVLAERTEEAEAQASTIRSEADTYDVELRGAAATYDAETRTAADIYASGTREAADAAAAEVRAESEQVRAEADTAAALRLEASNAEVEAILDEAREEGRAMVEEARTYRERVIADLADRRRAARAQLDELVSTRDSLAVTLTDVAGRIEASHRALADAIVDHRDLGDVTADREALDSEPPSVAVADEPAVEAELVEEEAIEVVPEEPEPEPEPEIEPEPEPEPEIEPEPDPVVDPRDAEDDELEAAAIAEGPEPEPEPVPEEDPRDVEDDELEAAAIAEGPEPEREPDPVEAVFAQLKAEQSRPGRRAHVGVAQTERVEPAAQDEPVRQQPAATPPEGSGSPAPGADDLAALDRRDAATDAIERQLARRLKRVLSDEQNELLDRVRRAKGAPTADDVLLKQGEHQGRYHEAALADLIDAERAGAGFFGEAPASAAEVSDVAEVFASELVRQLRGRLESAFVADADEQEISDRIRACYREWKTQRIADAAAHHVLVAFNRGVAHAAPDGSAARWVVDDGGSPCPDCDDNALAGAVPAGEAFPTGDLAPPAHPGCRCLAVPA